MTGILPSDLRAFVIRPALIAINLGGDAAEELLLGTALQESGGGARLVQLRGPALSPWQIEPETHDYLAGAFLARYPVLRDTIFSLRVPGLPALVQLPGNLLYACAVARVKFYSSPEPLPASGDLAAQAAYYVRVYNAGGRATVEEYTANWNAAKAA